MRLLLITIWVLLLNLVTVQTIGFSQSHVEDFHTESYITTEEEIYLRELSSLIKLSKCKVIQLLIKEELESNIEIPESWETFKTRVIDESNSTKNKDD